MRRHSRAAQTAAATPAPSWSRQRMLLLLVAVFLAAAVLLAGLVLAVVDAIHPTRHDTGLAAATGGQPTTATSSAAAAADPKDALAARPMPSVGEDAAHPAPVSTTDPGPAIALPAATRIGPSGVPTGFPPTPAGALAQLAAIDQTALQSGSLAEARAVIAAWALPDGPTGSTWSVIAGLATLFDETGLSGGGSPQLAIVLTPVMGLIKGSVGSEFVIPCLDFELDVTLQQTARGAVADCQRLVWTPHPGGGARWMIGSGAEPATPPSVWPDTDTAIAVGYRDLRPEPGR
jgi:hypothetical protein